MTHIVVRQKSIQHCEAIILQLKINLKNKNKQKNTNSLLLVLCKSRLHLARPTSPPHLSPHMSHHVLPYSPCPLTLQLILCAAHFANKPVLRSSDTISPEGLPWHHTCCYWNGANPTQHSPCCLSRTTAYGIITLFPCPSHPFNYKSLSLWGSSAS